MNKITVCILSTLLFSSIGHTHDLADSMERVLPSITYIRAQQFTTVKDIDPVTKGVTEKRVEVNPIVGTGFIIEDNIVVTNHHVIDNAIKNKAEIYVSFIESNTRHLATVIGYDKITDVALLEIEGKFPSIIISECDSLRMGSEVFTISHFYGIGWSGTNGIVSSTKRTDPRYPYVNNLQVQLLSGSGSSGGPVFNADGNVVGLNRSIVSMFPRINALGGSSRMLSMVAFPVRGDSMIEAIASIKEQTVVTRLDLGVQMIPFGADSTFHLNEDADFFTGIIVYRKDRTSDTTLKASDLIVSVDNQTFTSPLVLLAYLDENYKIGEVVKLYVYRDEKLINIDVTLEAVGS